MSEPRDLTEILDRVRAHFVQQRREEKEFFSNLRENVFDVYRLVLGDDFTPQGVIKMAQFGGNIKNWEALDLTSREILYFFGARFPEGVNDSSLIEKYGLSSEKIEEMKSQGVKFSNGISKGWVAGIVPLSTHYLWLPQMGSHSMGYGDYDLENKVTANAILAHQKAFAEAVCAAGKIKVQEGFNGSVIGPWTEIKFLENFFGRFTGTTFEYDTEDKKKARIDLFSSSLESIWQRDLERSIYDLFFEGKFEGDHSQYLLRDQEIGWLVGTQTPKDIKDEMRINVFKKYLNRTIDFGKNPELIVVDPFDPVQVSFLYPLKFKGEDKGLFGKVVFNERYGQRYFGVVKQSYIDERLEHSRHIKEMDPSFNFPIEPSMSVRDYITKYHKFTKQSA